MNVFFLQVYNLHIHKCMYTCMYMCTNMCIYIFLQYLKAVITPECLLILDYRNLNLEQWLFRELPSQLAGEGQLVTYPLPFEFRAIEALLQYRVSLFLFSFLNLFWC